jgi:hypothetical protein
VDDVALDAVSRGVGDEDAAVVGGDGVAGDASEATMKMA